jgi:hypothetical protein
MAMARAGSDPRERLGRTRPERERLARGGRPLGLGEERARKATVVSHTSRRTQETEHRAAAVGLEIEDVLVELRGARRLAQELLPEERPLLEERDPPAGIFRAVGGLRVELDELPYLARRRLDLGRRHEAGQRVEGLGVSRARDPRRLEVEARLVGPTEVLLEHARRTHEGASALRRVEGLGRAP